MKCATIPVSQIIASNRMDAGFHLAKKEHEKTEARLRSTMTKEEAAALVQHMIEKGPKIIIERLRVYARGNAPEKRIDEIPRDHPYEAAAMIVDSRSEIEAAMDAEIAAAIEKQKGFDLVFSAVPQPGEGSE